MDVHAGDRVVMARGVLQQLFDGLRGRGFRLVGPTMGDGAIVYGPVESVDELPIGWTDELAPGTYRLRRRDDAAVFGYTVGPQSWKRELFPPTSILWEPRSDAGESAPTHEKATMAPFAFIGVRPCDLAAIGVQDRVFMGGAFVDPTYAARRTDAFVVAVNCGQAGGTCFCASMGTGPTATSGFDLALTELLDGARHDFLVEIGSARGAEVMAEVPRRPAEAVDLAWAARIAERTTAAMGRSMDTVGIKQLLYANYEHPRWDDVAARCLACTNCTLVCPTCFCFGIDDTTDLAGDAPGRQRVWDSCFTLDHSYIHGGSVRVTNRARYRQWMTHKLATWIDQFGTSGCVGCGRCITWCPVGIDITEEVAAIRASPGATRRKEARDGDA